MNKPFLCRVGLHSWKPYMKVNRARQFIWFTLTGKKVCRKCRIVRTEHLGL